MAYEEERQRHLFHRSTAAQTWKPSKCECSSQSACLSSFTQCLLQKACIPVLNMLCLLHVNPLNCFPLKADVQSTTPSVNLQAHLFISYKYNCLVDKQILHQFINLYLIALLSEMITFELELILDAGEIELFSWSEKTSIANPRLHVPNLHSLETRYARTNLSTLHWTFDTLYIALVGRPSIWTVQEKNCSQTSNNKVRK